MGTVFWLALAGALGTITRFAMVDLVQRVARPGFPWGTAAVNVMGCFLTGLFWAVARHHLRLSNVVQTAVLVGFLGGFTTFSAMMLETGRLARSPLWLHAAGNLLLQNALGLGSMWLGWVAGRHLL